MAKKKENPIEIVVVKRFRDRNDHQTWYEAGSKLTFDESRANDVIKRGLAELYDPEGDDTGKDAGEGDTLNTNGNEHNNDSK